MISQPLVDSGQAGSTVLVLDRALAFAEGIARLLTAEGLDTRAMAPADAADAIDAGCRVLVLSGDDRDDAAGSVEVARCVNPDLGVVILTSDGVGEPSASDIPGAIWLSRNSSPEALITSIRALLDNRRVDASALRGSRMLPDQLLADRLTRREVTILRFLAQAKGNQEIGELLDISPHTVRTHVQNLLFKLGAHSRVEAVAIASRIGVVDGRRPLSSIR